MINCDKTKILMSDFIEDDMEGLKYLSGLNYKPQKSSTCRFYYIEDSNGPDYKSNFCN